MIGEAKKHATNVHISSIPPRQDSKEGEEGNSNIQEKIDNINLTLAVLTAKHDVAFINHDNNFRFQDGTIDNTVLGSDCLHLSCEGVKRLINNLEISELAKCAFGTGPTNRWQHNHTDHRIHSRGQHRSTLGNDSSSRPHNLPKHGTQIPNHQPQGRDGKYTRDNSRKHYFKGGNSTLSNFHQCQLIINGRRYHSSEQAYQHKKAVNMMEYETARMIMNTRSAFDAKQIGNNITTDSKWKKAKCDVMAEILSCKADQNTRFVDELVNTGTEELVEDTSHPFWGRGRNNSWQNMLGQLLMDLRRELNDSYNNKPNSQYGPDTNGQPQCWNCGETNHLRKGCRYTAPLKCYLCRYSGHKQKQCPDAAYK